MVPHCVDSPSETSVWFLAGHKTLAQEYLNEAAVLDGIGCPRTLSTYATNCALTLRRMSHRDTSAVTTP